jgi:hypothetical protein
MRTDSTKYYYGEKIKEDEVGVRSNKVIKKLMRKLEERTLLRY